MKVAYKDKEFDLHYSFRINMMYEESTGEFITPKTKLMQMDVVKLFYFTVLATWHYNKADIDISWEDFCNWIDDNGGEWLIVKFSKWYESAVYKQRDLMKELDEKEKEEDNKKK